MGAPPIIGFAVRVGGEPPAPPTLTAAGARVAVDVSSDERGCRGWVVSPAGESAAGGTASAEGVTVLFAGELHHREALFAAVGTGPGSSTDAELLLACWLRYGPTGLRLLDGRFAAVVTERGAVVAATDHAGSIPLYMYAGAAGPELATEAKAFAPGSTPRGTSLPGTVPVPGVPGVHRIAAGTAVTAVPGTAVVTAMRTWCPPEHRELCSPENAVTRVADALDAAVRTRLDSGPITVVLSGGIDSSAVAALAHRAGSGTAAPVTTVSLGTDAGDEFNAARLVAGHLGTHHRELQVGGDDVVRGLPWAVAAAEIVDADVLEYLLPLVALYRKLPGEPQRILTGYGADIPLGGMHRGTAHLDPLDAVITADMAGFDGLNEMSPVLGALAGHWTTHPYWDRAVLDLLVRLEPGLKRRNGQDKWVLREAVAEMLPAATVARPKLGIHEGSGTTSTWTALLRDAGVAADAVAATKRAMAEAIHRRVVRDAMPPAEVDFDDVLHDAAGPTLAVTR